MTIAMPIRRITTSPTSPRSVFARHFNLGLALIAATFVLTRPMTAALNPGAAGSPADLQQTGGPTPVTIGNQIAGSFGDATGHSAQSHLVYAANARVWWLFTLTSRSPTPRAVRTIRQVVPLVGSGPDDRDVDRRRRQSAARRPDPRISSSAAADRWASRISTTLRWTSFTRT